MRRQGKEEWGPTFLASFFFFVTSFEQNIELESGQGRKRRRKRKRRSLNTLEQASMQRAAVGRLTFDTHDLEELVGNEHLSFVRKLRNVLNIGGN